MTESNQANPGGKTKLKKFGELVYLTASLPVLVPFFIAYAAAVNVCQIGEERSSGRTKKMFESMSGRLRKMK